VKVSPGRPSFKSVYKNKWEFKYSIQWELNKQALSQASKTDGIFPLITNTTLEACEVLRKYKSQPFLEKRMYTKKTVLEVAPVFLKKESRIEAIFISILCSINDCVPHRTKDSNEYGKRKDRKAPNSAPEDEF